MFRGPLMLGLLVVLTTTTFVRSEAPNREVAPHHNTSEQAVCQAATNSPGLSNARKEPDESYGREVPMWPSLAVLGIMVILRVKLRHHWATTRDDEPTGRTPLGPERIFTQPNRRLDKSTKRERVT